MNNTRERILDATAELFRRQGYSGTGLKEIVAAADAPFGSLYHHFPGGKAELTEETITRGGAFYAAFVGAKLTDGPDVVDNIRAAFNGAGEALIDSGYADACPIAAIALEVASTDERLRMATAQVFDSWLELLAGILIAGGVDTNDAHHLSQVILAALEGAFILCRATRTTDALRACGDAMAQIVEAAVPARPVRRPARARPRKPLGA